MVSEKRLRCSETLGEQTPQTASADFGPLAIESFHRTFGMFVLRLSDLLVDAHPIPHGSNLTKWHTRLRHAKRTGIHAEKQHPLAVGPETLEITGIGSPSILQWLIDTIDRVRTLLRKRGLKTDPETVTGLSVQDFHLLVRLKVFNTEQMNQAVFAFRRYEDASLRYTGLDSHPGLVSYGLYDTVVAVNAEAS